MSETSFWRRRWKLIVNIATIAALALMFYALRDEIADTIDRVGQVHAWALLLLIPVEAINYHSQAKLYQHLFRIVGNKLKYSFLLKASLELNFVNNVFPSGGVTGMSYFTLRLRRGNELTGGKATLVQVIKLGLVFLSFEIMIVLGVIALAVMGQVSGITIMVATALSTLLLVGTFGFVYIVGSNQRINSFFTTITKFLNWLIKIVRPKHPETINISRARQVFDDFHDNYRTIRDKRQQLKAPFWYALAANVTEVMAVYVVFIAFGHWVNIGAVILAYAVANFAGFISVLPGGVGIYEALMVGVLATAGVPPAVSLPVIVMYRIANTVLQLPPGYYFYHKAIRSGQPSAREMEGV